MEFSAVWTSLDSRPRTGYFVDDDISGKLGIAVGAAEPEGFADVAFRLMTDRGRWIEVSDV